jgi:hypothetical protein
VLSLPSTEFNHHSLLDEDREVCRVATIEMILPADITLRHIWKPMVVLGCDKTDVRSREIRILDENNNNDSNVQST